MLIAEAPNVDPWVATILLQFMTYIFIQFLFKTKKILIRHGRHPVRQEHMPHVKLKDRPACARQRQRLTPFLGKVDCCVGRWLRLATSCPLSKVVELTVTAFPGKSLMPSTARFDTDFFKVCIDTEASCSMSGDMAHFVNLVPVQ